MNPPPRLLPLLEDGLIDGVVAQLMSGKEAQVYIVECNGQRRCAKVFKEANKRSFKQAVQYQEGRSVRNSRRARAMSKKTRYGQQEQESAWLNAEVDALRKLAAAGVRVPEPYTFVDGVLLMELIIGADGLTAPRLGDLEFTADEARAHHEQIISEIVRMLCAGLIHGDLSPFNVLIDAHGPVIIDLPQAVNASGNNSAHMMLERDVRNMREFFGRFAPELLETDYGNEIWALYEAGNLQEDSRLTGSFQQDDTIADLAQLMAVIEAAKKEEAERLARAALALEQA
jgi:RIO kinase 1